MKSLCLILTVITCFASLTGCARPEFNMTPATGEDDSLFDVIQLTHGFERAGESYFSPDMRWIIFQAAPKGQAHYQMYVAPVMRDTVDRRPMPGSVHRATPMSDLKVPRPDDIVRLGEPIRISPENSRNTCGWFSNDGNSIVFGSTSGKEQPDDPAAGYQRQGRSYRWDFSQGMEIYRADGWESALAAAEPGKIVDLAKHALTDNDAYDAECSFSPDGKSILFASNRTGDVELFAMRADGSNVVQLTTTPGYDGGPFFSPDGNRIVYRSDRQKNDLLQIFVADVIRDGTGDIVGLKNERQLTRADDIIDSSASVDERGKNVAWGPYWHPGGKHIIYATSAHGHRNYELYLMRADGSSKTRITFKDGPDLLPAFSPDGKYLMWTSRRSSDGSPQVMLAKFRMPKGS